MVHRAEDAPRGRSERSEGDPSEIRHRFFVACAMGGVAAFLIFTWLLVEGSLGSFFDRVPLSNFYDAQAHSWLDGRWDIPRAELSLEPFIIDGKAYTYFGPWPSLLRVPFAIFTDSLDGRLSRLSILVAFGVALWFASRLLWQVRETLRPGSLLTKAESIGTAVLMAVVGAGSTILFLASRAWVYHEALIWAIALTLASFSFLVTYLQQGETRTFVWAGVTAGLALLSRATVGAAPVVALGVLLAVRLAADVLARRASGRERSVGLLRWVGIGDRAAGTPRWALLAATVAPLVAYAYVNYSRFGSLFGLPIDKQLLIAKLPDRAAALAANNGSLFGLKFVPTTLLAYWRPDAIGFDRLFPWFTFGPRARVVGDAKFDVVDFQVSITTTAVLLCVLLLVSGAVLFRPNRENRERAHVCVFRIPFFAAVIGGLAVLPIAFVAQRYEADFAPLLVVGGVIGFQWLWWAWDRSTQKRAVRRTATVAFVVLAVWSLASIFAISLQYQRMYAPTIAMETRADFVDTQLDVADVVPIGLAHVPRGDALPQPATGGSFFVIGDCDGLYWSSGRAWHPLVITPRTGLHHLRVTFDDAPVGTVEPVVVVGTPERSGIVRVEYLGNDRVRFSYGLTGTRTYDGSPVRLPADRRLDLRIVLDPAQGYVQVIADDETAFALYIVVPEGPATLGRLEQNSNETRFGGQIRRLPTSTALCRRLVDKS
jgi:hypothetical protein